MRDLPRVFVCLTVAVGISLTSPTAWAAQPEPVEPVDVALQHPSEPGSPEATPEATPASPEPAPLPESDTLPNVDDPELEPSVEPPLAVEPSPPEELEPDQDLDEDLDHDDADDGFDGYDPMRDSPEAFTARRWLGAGIGATITGAVLVGGAIALSQTTPCDSAAGNNCFAEARDRAAVTMGVPGGVLLLGGIAMTVVGALQKRRIKAGLALAPGEFGVLVVGRF